MHREPFISKITRPALHRIYLREKFFDILDECRGKPAITMIAPQGSGKTFLVSSYIESRGLKCLWYQVDQGDRDPATFFHYLGIAAEKANPGKKIQLPHLTPEYQNGIQSFTREYFSRLYRHLGKNSLIIFDNYHELPVDSVLHDLLRCGLDEIPAGINIVIISRTALPSVLSRMRLSKLMEVITWDELRLTIEEMIGIASQRGVKIDEHDGRKMLARTEGWATGLIFMLDAFKSEDIPAKDFDRHDPGAVFNYFADELFVKFSPEVSEFLLKTSVLPAMTAEMAMELTGNKAASSIISGLVDKNYFIQSYFSDRTYYQYHHLFRDFLVTRLKNNLPAGELAGIERNAASLLAAAGRTDDALALYRRLGDWDPMVSLVLKEAPLMLRQGRHQTLMEWLDSVPGHMIDKTPWLLYWKGGCHMPFDQRSSMRFFEKAYEAFRAGKDPAGIFPSWCGQVEAVIHGFDDLKTLDRLIYAMEGLLTEYPALPSAEIEGRVSLCMFMALSFRAPQHPRIGEWVDRTCDLVKAVSDHDMLATIILYLVDYFLWVGDMEKADLLVETASKRLRNRCHSPLALIAVKLTEALNAWYHGRSGLCVKAVSEGLEVAEAQGVSVFNYFLFGHGAVNALTSGDLNGAEEYLEKAGSVLDERRRFCASYYHHTVACWKLLRKDFSGAFESEKLSFDLARETGSPFAEGMTRAGLALLHHKLGETRKAASEIAKARGLAIKTRSALIEFVAAVFDAYFSLDGGHRSAAIEKLKYAMALGSKKGFVNFHMWHSDMMARLCMLSLSEGIEVEYARRIILERDIFPDDADLLLEDKNWPWRIRIYAMRGFSIVKDGVRLGFEKKAPRKILDLLKLLIALGGTDVPESRMLDALWEDSDGDAAHVAFTTILKRLRRMLGFDDAIVLRNGCLTINRRYCWVDAHAFTSMISRAESAGFDGACAEASARLLERAIVLYSPRYDIAPADSHWAILFYENLKSKFVRAVMKLGACMEKAGEIEKAVECYRKGIDKEPLLEELYKSLMVCLAKNGFKAEALALYESVAKLFREVLGVEPSLAITKTFNDIHSDLPSKP